MEKFCAHCGEKFSTLLIATKYCSARCRWEKWATKERASRPIYTITCKHCKVEFTSTLRDKLFCSPPCRYDYFNKKRIVKKIDKRICPQCGVEFQPKPKRGVGSTYCSDSCKNKFNYRKAHKSIKLRRAAWHKKNKWGGNWETALTRDKYTCQVCNKQLYPSQWSKNLYLEVHHKDGSGETDNKNHFLDNLVTLCGSCHKEFHAKINLVEIDGQYYIRGDIFRHLGLVLVPTLDSENSNAWQTK